jgi:hypothetical protein
LTYSESNDTIKDSKKINYDSSLIFKHIVLISCNKYVKNFGSSVTYSPNESKSSHEEIKTRLKSANACCYLSPSLPSKNVKIKIYRTITFPVVLYGCETWSLILREECRLRVFENRVPRKLFEPKRDEVTGERRRSYNKELYALHSSLNIIRKIRLRRLRWAGNVARTRTCQDAYRVLVGKPEGRRLLGTVRENNIKMDFREEG